MEDRPFGDAIAYLERYYGGSIFVVGDALRRRPVTGIFDLNDPEAALRTMAKALDAEVRRVSPWLLLVSAFAGRARVLAAYAHAVRERYRFFSYGDAMLLSRSDE